MKKENLYTFLILGIIIVIFAFTSIITLFSQSIRLDESQSVWQAIMPLNALVPFVGRDVAELSFLLILHFWLQFFGINIFYTRLLSLIFLLISIPILYQVFFESSNRKIALVSVGLFSLSPFIYFYSSESRDYSLLILVSALSHLFFLRMMRSDGKSGKMGYFLSTLGGIFTHYFFLFYMFSQFLYVLYRLGIKVYQDADYKKIKLWSMIWKNRQPALSYFILTGIVFLLFSPWVIYVASLGFAANDQPLIPKPDSYSVFQIFSNFIFGFQNQNIESLIISLWPLAVIGFFFIFTQRVRIKVGNLFYFIFVTFVPILLVFFISYFIRSILLARYLIFTVPTLFFIISWILLSYPKKISSFLIATLAFAMIGLLFYQNISNNTSAKEDYFQVDQYLNRHVQPGDIVLVSAPFTYFPVVYGYNGNAEVSTIPSWSPFQSGAIPSFSVNNLQNQMNGYKKVYENVFVVLSYSQGYEDNIITYMDDHFQREKLIEYTPDLSIREYRLRYN